MNKLMKLKRTQIEAPSFYQFIIDFYQCILQELLSEASPRGYYQSLTLLTLREYMLFQIQISLLVNQSDLGTLSQLVFRPGHFLGSDESIQTRILEFSEFIFLSLNVALVLVLLGCLLFTKIRTFESVRFAFTVFKHYEYLIFLPSLCVSFQLPTSTILSFINIPLTLFIGILIGQVDFTYQFEGQDHLKKFQSELTPIIMVLDLGLVISFTSLNPTAHCSFSFCLNLLKLFFCLRNHTYVNDSICQIYFTSHVYKIFQSFFIVLFLNNVITTDLLFLACLTMYPVSMRVGFSVFTSYQRALLNSLLHTANGREENLVQFHKLNQELEFIKSIRRTRILFRNNNHDSITIKLGSEYQEITKENEKEEFTSEAILRGQISDEKTQHILDFIEQRYLELTDNELQLTDAHFSYLSFKVSSCENICASFQSILNLKHKYVAKMSFSQEQKLNLAYKEAQKLADEHEQTSKSKTNGIRKLTSFGKSNNNNNIQAGNFVLFSIIDFDKEVSQIQADYFACLQLKQQGILQLAQSFIEVNNVLSYLKLFRDERNKLSNQLRCLIQKNSQSQQLRALCMNFDYYLDENSNLSLQFEKFHRQTLLSSASQRRYYDSSSGLAFVSLLKQQYGQVTHVSKNFTKLFGGQRVSSMHHTTISKKSTQTKNKQQVHDLQFYFNNCLTLNNTSKIPTNLSDKDNITTSQQNQQSQHHQQGRNSFLERNFEEYGEIISIPLLIGRNQQGYALPFEGQVQSQKISDQDFGFTIWTKPILDDKMYMLLDSKHPSRIITISKRFQEEFLYDDFQLSHFSRIRAETLIPCLRGFLSNLNSEELPMQIDTILVKPIERGEAFEELKFEDNPRFLYTVASSQLYFVTLTFNRTKNSLVDMLYVTIDQFYYLSERDHRIEAVINLQNQLQEMLGISLEFDPSGAMKLQSFMKQQQTTLKHISLFSKRKQFNINQASVSDRFEKQSTRKSKQIHNSNSQQFSNLESVWSEDRFKVKDSLNIDDRLVIQTSKEEDTGIGSCSGSPYGTGVQGQLLNSDIPWKYDAVLGPEESKDSIRIEERPGLFEKKISVILTDEGNQTKFNLQLNVNEFNNNNNILQINSNNESRLEQSSIIYMGQNQQQQQRQFTNSNLNNEGIMNESSQRLRHSEQQIGIGSKDNPTDRHLVPGNFFTTFKRTQNRFEAGAANVPVVGRNSNLDDYTQTGFESQFIGTKETHTKEWKKLEKSSVTSSQRSAADRHLITLIHMKKELVHLQVINVMGLLSILVTLILTLTGFQIFVSRMQTQLSNFSYMNWLYNINIQISFAFSEFNAQLLQKNGLWKLSSPTDNKSLDNFFAEKLPLRFSLSVDLLEELHMNTNPDIQIFQLTYSKQLNQKIFYSRQSNFTIETSLLYSLNMLVGNVYQFVSGLDPTLLFRYAGQINYPTVNSMLDVVNLELENSFKQQLDEISNQSQLQLFVVMAVLFVFFCSIIPSYKFSKAKQQKVLELFSTFDPKHLREILVKLTSQLGGISLDKTMGEPSSFSKGISSNNNMSDSTHRIDSSLQITKKMNISRTSKLSYSMRNLYLGLIVLFMVIMIYPVMNYFVVRKFMNNSKIIYSFNVSLDKMYMAIANSLRARQGVSIGYLLPQYQGLPLSSFQNFYEKTILESNQVMHFMQQNLNDIKDLTIYNDEQFKGFLIPLMEENACVALNNNSDYSQNLNFEQCKVVGKAILTSGFLLACQRYFERFKEVAEFIYSYDRATYEKAFDTFNSGFSGLAQQYFKDNLTVMLDALLLFFIDQNKLLYGYYLNISIVMFTYQITLIFLLYAFGWRFYYKSINSSIFETKDLLDIIPSNVIAQNSYIMSYLKKNE